ncbi:hypothetical protein BK128_19180 [Viridibacillus sp. FSL H7-0596]|uniref:Uncharacterized protein n=1 Tax=Viridibacillus arenosi FSL R5-213 TaxID=1227360 RepID=W4F412_9BACL|nr:hypothetical protein C176_08812 [Viridibacillus arenosi FSL R5-213]OMC83237.1 hypothetical protein BK128_19180 [Viridibacillus sp. FSL H7-0596]OMC88250.1 hypothetical protein BK137_19515 [Viridibacillus arenosi]
MNPDVKFLKSREFLALIVCFIIMFLLLTFIIQGFTLFMKILISLFNTLLFFIINRFIFKNSYKS